MKMVINGSKTIPNVKTLNEKEEVIDDVKQFVLVFSLANYYADLKTVAKAFSDISSLYLKSDSTDTEEINVDYSVYNNCHRVERRLKSTCLETVITLTRK